MTLGKKIVLITTASVALSTVVAVLVQKMTIRKQGIELTVNTMRSAIIAAESVRTSVASMRTRHSFDDAALASEARTSTNIRGTRLYDTIPVVAAWKSLQDVAKQEGFEFRVVKHQARNPQNEPNPAEAAILDFFEKSGEREYSKIDSSANTITYARPVRLTADCLSCHGDPSTSPTHNGKDAAGFQMEGWHEGEIHGEFILTARMDQTDKVASAKAQSEAMATTLMWMIPTGLLIAGGFFYYSRKSVVEPLQKVVETIHRASAETSEASNQISATSQSLAQSASEQAASLETISSSLNSVTEETRATDDGARQARSLADENSAAAARGSEDMQRMEAAMEEIGVSTRSVSKIVKTIDEVAFQTNILALNAAVEAARAGEAGAGFAVVADEVRALAQRSADAARQTTALVSDAIERSNKGFEICSSVVARLGEISERGKPLQQNVSNIANSATEQRNSIEQLTGSVQQLNVTTQGVAAIAEESAAAAGQLSYQSKDLLDAVSTLSDLVGTK